MWLLAEASTPPCVASELLGCLSILTTWQLASPTMHLNPWENEVVLIHSLTHLSMHRVVETGRPGLRRDGHSTQPRELREGSQAGS